MSVDKFRYSDKAAIDTHLTLFHNMFPNNLLDINIESLLALVENRYRHSSKSLLYRVKWWMHNGGLCMVIHIYMYSLYLFHQLSMSDYSHMDSRDMDLMVFHTVVPYATHHTHTHNEFLLHSTSPFDMDYLNMDWWSAHMNDRCTPADTSTNNLYQDRYTCHCSHWKTEYNYERECVRMFNLPWQ